MGYMLDKKLRFISNYQKTVSMPTDYHEMGEKVQEMVDLDSSGLVCSLVDYQINAAIGDWNMESDSTKFNSILSEWLQTINSAYVSHIPVGIKALSREYYSELWKGSSFPVLKILKWGNIQGFKLPTELAFLDGNDIYAEEKEHPDFLNSYNYYLGSDKVPKNLLNKGVLFSKPYERWDTEYPTPYLFKRGIYENWKIIDILKSNQLDTLAGIIPYMMLILKGTERLATDKVKKYSSTQLDEIKEKIRTLANDVDNATEDNIPIRVAQFDEEIKHVVPDLVNMFKSEMFCQAEKSILAGLGFVEIISGVTTSRRESVLNPKIFIEETNKGIEGFKQLLFNLMVIIYSVNRKKHPKFCSKFPEIHAAPIKAFLTQEIKDEIRKGYERGNVSRRTYSELCPETNYNLEKRRRMEEIKDGDETIMYAQIIVNNEKDISPIESQRNTQLKGKTPEEVTGDNVPDAKKGTEKNNFIAASMDEEDLEIASWKSIENLPEKVKSFCLDLKEQKIFLKVFNNAWTYYSKKYEDKKVVEALAFRTTYSQVKKMRQT